VIILRARWTPLAIAGEPPGSAAKISRHASGAVLKRHLNDRGEGTLSDSDLVAWFVDPGLEFHPDDESTSEDRMFISTPGIGARARE
jgi:hypothetical protein